MKTPINRNEAVCDWTQNGDGYHKTGCNKDFLFTEDGVEENGFCFCPFCGKAIFEIKYKEEEK
jgi:hypothetical protein